MGLLPLVWPLFALRVQPPKEWHPGAAEAVRRALRETQYGDICLESSGLGEVTLCVRRCDCNPTSAGDVAREE